MNAVGTIAWMTFNERWSHKKFFWLISVVALFMFSNVIVGYLIENEFLRTLFLSPSQSFQSWHFFLFLIVLFQAAGSVKREFAANTAQHTLAHPITRHHWCLGKLTGVLLFYYSLVGILLLLILTRALYADVALGWHFAWGVLQTVLHASAIVTIGFSLGIFWGSGPAVFIIVIGKIFQVIALKVASTEHLWRLIVSKILYYGLPSQQNTDLFQETDWLQASTELGAVILYAAVLFVLAMTLFQKRNLPIRSTY